MNFTYNDPDEISVTVTEEQEIEADYADLYVTIKGSSYIMGDAALSKAREVGQLVAALTQAGIQEADIRLQGVLAEASSGMLGRSSSASYHLKIHCPRLELLPDLLGAITSQKNTTLRITEWGYSSEKELLEALMDKTLRAVMRRAQRTAETLGVRLLGIYNLREERNSTYKIGEVHEAVGGMQPMRSRSFQDELGLVPTHSKKLQVTLYANFRVSSFEA